jgi:tetratricopeptide (TPR) repeat protein
MPVSKKRRRAKSNPRSPKGSSTRVTLPDRRAMEGFMAAIGGRQANDAIAKAQQVMYDAWDQTDSRARTALAHKALTISPLCADAYVLLAEEEAKSVDEALEYYRKGVEVAEQALGTKRFKEYAGHFWGFLETRPYMRARAGLAAILYKRGEIDAAISHYQDMLTLNPNDNQGIRYVLAQCLMRKGDTASSPRPVPNLLSVLPNQTLTDRATEPIEGVFAHCVAGRSQRLQLVALSLGDGTLNLGDGLSRPIKIDGLGKALLKNRQRGLKCGKHLCIDFAQSGVFVLHLRRVNR